MNDADSTTKMPAMRVEEAKVDMYLVYLAAYVAANTGAEVALDPATISHEEAVAYACGAYHGKANEVPMGRAALMNSVRKALEE